MTTVEIDSGSGYTSITYASVEIHNGLSDVRIAPEATVEIPDKDDASSGDGLRITDSGTTLFEGTVQKTQPRRRSPTNVTATHDATDLFEETVDLSVSGTDEDVLSAALSAASSGGQFTLNYAGTATTLGEDYDVSGRSVKRVFRDMTDRVGRVWWVGVGDTIHVEPYGHRGTLATIDTGSVRAVVTSYVPDDLDTVINDVEVVGTGDVAVTGTAEDSTSISTYGRQPKRINVSYIGGQSEADDYASALLNPDPDPAASIIVPNDTVDVRQPVVNYTLAVTDAPTGLDDELVIEDQAVEQGRATLELGEGSGVNVAQFNQKQKSNDDVTEPGSVYGGDRIADDSVDTPKLVDTAVIEQKLADLSVSETKVQDDSIATPKLQADAVTAAKILAGTITASEIASGTITANEIDTLNLSSDEISVGTDADVQIVFDVITSGSLNTPVMRPTQDRTGIIGRAADYWERIYVEEVRTDLVNADRGNFNGGTTPIAITAESGEQIRSALNGAGGTDLYPNNDQTCRLGTSNNAFASMWSHNYYTASPPSFSQNAVESLRGADIGSKNLPEFVLTERPVAIDEGEEDDLEQGIDIGRVQSWLLSVCQEQQQTIEEYEQRLSNLEDRLTELEGKA